MKKRFFNAADVFIVLILAVSLIGIIVRAVRIADVQTEKNYDYRVAFTAVISNGQLDDINAGAVYEDKNGTTFRLLEGYRIISGEDSSTVTGQFVVNGRLTEKGFMTDGVYYYKNDAVKLKNEKTDFEAALLDFVKQ